jgi:hypothetical protein
MGFKLDALKKRIFAENETVNADFTSEAFDIDDSEQGITIGLVFNNGDGSVDVNMVVEGSQDGINFAPMTGLAEQQITDDDGIVIFDIININATFVRVFIEHTAGSFDIVELRLSSKARH